MYTSVEQVIRDALASVEPSDPSGALSAIDAAFLRLPGSRRVEAGGGHDLVLVPGAPGAVLEWFALSTGPPANDPAERVGAVSGDGHAAVAHTDGRSISFQHVHSIENASKTSGPFSLSGEGCERLLLHLRALTRAPLTPEALAGEFGPSSEASTAVSELASAIKPGHPLTAINTYFSLVCRLIAALALSLRTGLCARSPLDDAVQMDTLQLRDWLCQLADGRLFERCGVGGFGPDALTLPGQTRIADAVRPLIVRISRFEPATSLLRTVRGADLFRDLYQALIPAPLRRASGEHYTPDWLANLLLDRLGYDGNPQTSLYDPACGSGVFLTLAIRRARQGHSPDATLLDHIVANITGSDISPQAVTAARANYLLALSDLLRFPRRIELPVHQRDAISTPHSGPRFDMVVGNPPWVNWERLSPATRDLTREMWERYGLVHESPSGRFELGKKKLDLAMLFVCACADRYLCDGGKLGFVITQTVFKSQGGEGFRRFATPSVPLGVLSVDDMSDLRPFPDAATRTACLVLTRGRRTSYPVPYTLWRKARRGRIPDTAARSVVEQATTRVELAAQPFGGPAKPWVTARPDSLAALLRVHGPSPYRAHAGTVTWANAIYWARVIERVADGLLLVENVGDSRTPKQRVLIEQDLVHPLLRGRDVKSWAAEPDLSLILPHTPSSGWRALTEDEFRCNYPNASAYFARFRPELLSRSGHRQLRPGQPWYVMGNTGPWIHSPHKVVWREQAGILTCAVSEPFVPDWSHDIRTVIPDHKLMLVAVDEPAEAHYICAVLNSSPSRLLVRSYAVPTSISTHVLANVAVPRFDVSCRLHSELAELSRRAHAGAGAGPELDRAAASLWGLSGGQLAAIIADLRDRGGQKRA